LLPDLAFLENSTVFACIASLLEQLFIDTFKLDIPEQADPLPKKDK
jgi:hypothetical protein